MHEFKIGDVVKLKSADLPMTITNLADDNYKENVECVWFDVENKLQIGYFKKETLEVV
jgi:uncharacterized protein YodC (DUF2158 family)